jgi:hypothetical protein
MGDLRAKLIASGLLGLGGCVILSALAVYVIAGGMWSGLSWGCLAWMAYLFPRDAEALASFPHRWGWLAAWIAYLFLLAIALAEIPLMVIALRRMAAEGAVWLLLIINAVYVFFPAVYGLLLILVTGTLPAGLSICALSPLRLVAALLWVRQDRSGQLFTNNKLGD